MSKQLVLKWSSDTIIKFLEIYKSYEVLCDVSDKNYFKKNAREHNFRKLFLQLQNAGPEFQFPDEETLKRKIKSIKDCYRIELNKIKRSKKSGAGTNDVYKPKLAWFSKADVFLRNVASGREFSSNLVGNNY